MMGIDKTVCHCGGLPRILFFFLLLKNPSDKHTTHAQTHTHNHTQTQICARAGTLVRSVAGVAFFSEALQTHGKTIRRFSGEKKGKIKNNKRVFRAHSGSPSPGPMHLSITIQGVSRVTGVCCITYPLDWLM